MNMHIFENTEVVLTREFLYKRVEEIEREIISLRLKEEKVPEVIIKNLELNKNLLTFIRATQ